MKRQHALLTTLLLFGCASGPARPPRLLSLQGATERSFVEAQRPRALIARLQIEGLKVRRSKRPQVNLVLLMDISASMMGPPIEAAKRAAKRMMEELSDEDHLSVVTFSSSAETLMASAPLKARSREERAAIIDKIQAVGTTDLLGGLSAALREARRAKQEINRIVLLSDGVPNRGEGIRSLAQEASRQNISITALGFGLDYDEALLASIAAASRGKFHFVEDAEQIAQVFVSEVLNLKQVVARSAVLVLEPGPGVEVTEIVGQGKTRTLQLGELSEGDLREVLVRLSIPARPAERPIELLDARLRFSDVDGLAHAEHTFLMVSSSTNAAQLKAGRNEEVLRAAARAEAAAATLKAIQDVRNGDFEKAETTLERLEKGPENGPQQQNARALRQVMPQLRSGQKDDRRGPRATDPDYVLRKSHNEAWRDLR